MYSSSTKLGVTASWIELLCEILLNEYALCGIYLLTLPWAQPVQAILYGCMYCLFKAILVC
uniref:Uncharacterized protein n=1 Tax=Arundo donax TaxID=35708 RepID=A0A0A8ZTZ7_ARUDO